MVDTIFVIITDCDMEVVSLKISLKETIVILVSEVSVKHLHWKVCDTNLGKYFYFIPTYFFMKNI